MLLAFSSQALGQLKLRLVHIMVLTMTYKLGLEVRGTVR